MEDFVKKYKFVVATVTLKSLPSQVSKEFLDTAEFCGTYDYGLLPTVSLNQNSSCPIPSHYAHAGDVCKIYIFS